LLLKRFIVAFIFIPAFIFLIIKGGYFFLALVCGIIGVGLAEFYHGANITDRYIFSITCIIFIIFFWELFKLKTPHSEVNIGVNLGGILYVSYLFSYIVIMRELPFVGAKLVITVFFATWMGDTGAFTVGSLCGKHKFFPVYSSQKSVEGFLGAIAFSLLAMLVSRLWIFIPFPHLIILGVLAGAGGEMGDFFESMLKRGLGIKDFGRILPGHGGVLDRFDSLFFTVPIFFYYTRYLLNLG